MTERIYMFPSEDAEMYWKCPICDKEFGSYPDMRTPSAGVPWCKPCQDDFDSIDWEEVYQRREDGQY